MRAVTIDAPMRETATAFLGLGLQSLVPISSRWRVSTEKAGRVRHAHISLPPLLLLLLVARARRYGARGRSTGDGGGSPSSPLRHRHREQHGWGWTGAAALRRG